VSELHIFQSIHSRTRRPCPGNFQRTPFVFEPISFPNAGADLLCLATQSPIGSKRSANCWPRLVAKHRNSNTMESVLADLAQALRERLAVIGDEASRRDQAKHIDRLRAVSEKIDRLQESLPSSTDPRLKHYLDRKSYDKALEFLQDQL
jgi:hypothetical protein